MTKLIHQPHDKLFKQSMAVAFRLLVYSFRIMEMHLKQYPKSALPVVYPMVIYTGERSWGNPMGFFDLFQEQATLARQVLFQPFQLIDIHRLSDESLKQDIWYDVVAIVLKYRKARDVQKLFDLLFPWLDKIQNLEGIDFAKIVLKVCP